MKKKILLVDDEPEIQIIISKRLITAGYEVIIAKDGQQGLDMARSESPDAILLDLMIPKIDGFKVCRLLKFDRAFENIPVIIFSARGSDADKKMAEQVGASAYMVKPFNLDVFVETIQRLLGPQTS